MNKVLEFYPSTRWCIQWCFHCPRWITQPSWNVVQEISERQRELARNILYCFWDDVNWVNALNLSWYIWEYWFELFDDIWGIGLTQLYFNLGTLSNTSRAVIQENLSRLTTILPRNTWCRDIDIFWNLQCVAAWRELLDADLLQSMVHEFFKALQSWATFSTQEMTGLMLAANNATEKNRREIHLWDILSNFISAHSKLWNPTVVSDSIKDYPKKGVSFIRSDRVIDGKQTRIDFRSVSAKQSKKSTFLDELKLSLREDMDLTISIFPDTIMMYHSTWNMHIEELFFTYDEFEELLKVYICQTWSERYSLKRVIDERLAERAYNLWLFEQ